MSNHPLCGNKDCDGLCADCIVLSEPHFGEVSTFTLFGYYYDKNRDKIYVTKCNNCNKCDDDKDDDQANLNDYLDLGIDWEEVRKECCKATDDCEDCEKECCQKGCQCGADSVGSPRHSKWCPEYKEEDE